MEGSQGPPKQLLPLQQTIRFTGSDDTNSAEVQCQKVTIVPSSGQHESGSSKVKLKNMVDFSWELRFYTGQLLAVHVEGKYVAYGIKAVGKTNGVVRVVNIETGERSLLKGMEGMVQDIAFAYIPTQVILACVDEYGHLLVHQIEQGDDKLVCTLLLHVEQNNEQKSSSHHRVIWCPYIPEEENADISYDDVAKLLVLTHGSKAEMWNVGMVTSRHGVGPLRPENVEEGYLEIKEHMAPIVDAAFSPDGTALATASLDGTVKFFQVYMHNDSKPRCLHEWQPHDGKPLSSLFFLDNHKTYNPDVQFWKFAITGAENNSELKIWSCESWTCLQTIRFTPEVGQQNIVLKAGLDLGAGYLLLSDIHYKLLYVLEIHNDPAESSAYVRSASEFLLPHPVLSFGIVDAGVRKFKSTNSFSLEDLCNEDGDDEPQQYIEAVVVKMYLVQPKSLQECHIAFQLPHPPDNIEQRLNSISHDSLIFRDGLSELSAAVTDTDTLVKDLPANHIQDSPQPANRSAQQQQQQQAPPEQQQPQQLNLMTPDAFSSPAKKDSPTDLRSPQISHHLDTSPHITSMIIDTSISTSPALKASRAPPLEDVLVQSGAQSKCVEKPLATSELQEVVTFQREGFASGGSSPSREVEQILSLQDSGHLNHTYYDDKDIVDDVQEASTPLGNAGNVENNDFETSIKEKDSGSLKPSGPDTDGWPQIPISLVNEVRKSVAAEETSSKRSTSLHQDDVAVLSVNGEPKTQKLWKAQHLLEDSLTDIDLKVTSMLDMLQQHQLEIKKLHDNMLMMQHDGRAQDPVSPSSPQIEEIFRTQLNNALTKYEQRQMAFLEELLLRQEDKKRNQQEKFMSSITQSITNLLNNKLEQILTQEIKNEVIPALMTSIEPIKHQIHVEVSQKLSSTDHLLKENIAKLVHNKSVMEVLSNSAVTALQPMLQNIYKDFFTSYVLPSFEKCCQTMFEQLNDTFSKGTKEYLQSIDTYFEKQRRQQEKGRDLISHMQALSESMRLNQEHLSVTIKDEIHSQVQKSLVSLQDTLNKSVCETVKEHIDKGFRGQQDVIQNSVITAVRSRAVTPAPHIVDAHIHQLQIEQLISQGNINGAFQQALSASDLNLVVYICEKVNPQQVFNQTPCPLQQPVLLSLIQQLSADLSNNTELKHKYLEEAVMNLDKKNPLTREHMPAVLNALQRQLQSYISSNPNNRITRSMKLLLMATESLLQTG